MEHYYDNVEVRVLSKIDFSNKKCIVKSLIPCKITDERE
ncbi:hypothetical protein VCRA2110O318_320001 [Vibrio crassostreae]|nr:hypothetical protein VCRA2117O328_300006 [Vibrio crassostreae]CAK2323454.1 hypothetical protein VCRA2110O318_320001 [Vibrio crassostreae]CAK2451027.1 hypothetical protein VCRA2110O319_220033 [Vibrio crassostreae]CAK2771618.1 hypothetical protein VCRA217O317_220055 [Vibrio crassostreae]